MKLVEGPMVAALVALAALALAACREAAPNTADVVRADSLALATLPPSLAREFAVTEVLNADALRDSTRVRCELLGTVAAPEARRRLRAVLADGSRTVLFVRATRATGALQRVELVRRVPRAGQRGFIWTAPADSVVSVVWATPGASSPEVTTLPRVSPVRGALSAIGRRLLALPCAPPRPTSSARSPSA